MKKLLTIFVAFFFTELVTQIYGQTPCCTASGGKNRTICCPGGSVILNGSGTCNCTDTLPNDTILHCTTTLYRWTPTATLNNPNIAQPTASPTTTTTYTLTTYCVDVVHDDTCCSATSTVTVFVNATCCRQGQTPDDPASGVLIYPNPASKSVNLKLDQPLDNGEIIVYDNLGRTVLTQTVNPKDNITVIDISTLVAGSYVLHVRTQEGVMFSDVLLVE